MCHLIIYRPLLYWSYNRTSLSNAESVLCQLYSSTIVQVQVVLVAGLVVDRSATGCKPRSNHGAINSLVIVFFVVAGCFYFYFSLFSVIVDLLSLYFMFVSSNCFVIVVLWFIFCS